MVQMYTELLAVIEVWPEEGGRGAVRATLVELRDGVAQGECPLGPAACGGADAG